MNAVHRSVGALRERLLARELAEARELLASGNARDLVTAAEGLVADAETARLRFERFSKELETSGANRLRAFEEYLTDTVAVPGHLAGDLRALRRGGEDFDVAALADRLALRVNALEYRAEAFLAVARSTVPDLPPELVAPLLA